MSSSFDQSTSWLVIQTSRSCPFSNLLCLKAFSVLTYEGAETGSNFFLSLSQANAEVSSV
jgi:hypothetical protein